MYLTRPWQWTTSLGPHRGAKEKTYEAFKGFVSQLIADAAKEVTWRSLKHRGTRENEARNMGGLTWFDQTDCG